jgi:hypothetical protein
MGNGKQKGNTRKPCVAWLSGLFPLLPFFSYRKDRNDYICRFGALIGKNKKKGDIGDRKNYEQVGLPGW